ncbi:putative pectinesterase/pectinesterase inhibitor 41 [Nymphaea thermarum]|nr:putative pectinesterase/pectinesterase inhibitor 41 [Nymphaea thermarum]
MTTLCTTTIILLFTTLISGAFAQNGTSQISPANACSVTTDPAFCKSVIPPQTRYNLYGYGRYLVKKSLDQSATFSSLIDQTIRQKSSLTAEALSALRDCLFLSDLTTDFLVTSTSTLNSTDSTTLQDNQGDDVHTLLSAIVTNQQTCYDGLSQASFLKSGNSIYAPLINGSQLYRVSLAMFTHSWGPKHRHRRAGKPAVRKLLADLKVGHGGLPSWVNPGILGLKRRMALDTGSVLVQTIVTVAQDGSGNYSTISEAVAAAPNSTLPSKGYHVIYVKAGVYQEYVSVDKKKKNLMMVGDGINQTIITGNRSVGDGFTTFNSATLAVVGPNFIGRDFTVQNTAGPAKHQAVAVRNGADLSTFYRCSFEAYQDTLYTHSLRQFYRECDIYGTVDFIFGNAAVVFQNCNLYARLPMSGQQNMFTAQGRTDPNQNTGTSIINCSISATADLSANGQIKSFLGRPWKNYSRTVYMESVIDSVIDPSGWAPWSGDDFLSTLYYGEYSNTGPGSNTSSRVTWPGYHVMSSTDASNFTVTNFVEGDVWLPATSVPFSAGLA